MTFKYKKECMVIASAFIVCLGIFFGIKVVFFNSIKMEKPIEDVINYYNNDISNAPKMAYATTEKIKTTRGYYQDIIKPNEEEEEIYDSFYEEAPSFEDDGSIIYDGLTMTELTDKLNKSLNSYLANTGYYFADYTKRTGLDPYLSVAIVLLETGCKWKCSSLTVECNNIGGLKGTGSCRGGNYSKYDSLEEGIDSYLDIIYNNYYLKGMDTAEKMAPKYAQSSEWSNKVNTYINEIKSK